MAQRQVDRRRIRAASSAGNPPKAKVAQRDKATAAGRMRSTASQQRAASGGPLRIVGIVMGLAAIIGLLLLLGYVVLSNTSAFAIASIDTESTEHVSAESIARLANVAEGTTLLNVNENKIREGLEKNPWIGSVEIVREFPDRLRIVVTERSVTTLVTLGSDGVVWCLGSDYVWIEPLDLAATEGQTVAEAALAEAKRMGTLLVTDVPTSVVPQAAAYATDEELEAIKVFREQLSPSFMSEVVSMSAPSPEGISCVLANGVEVSLGAAGNIATKESIVTELLERYPNRLTYINVRIPSNPSYRLIDSDAVREGTGATGEMAYGDSASTSKTSTENNQSSKQGNGSSEELSDVDGSSEEESYTYVNYDTDEAYVY